MKKAKELEKKNKEKQYKKPIPKDQAAKILLKK
jgi:hypothetical protein